MVRIEIGDGCIGCGTCVNACPVSLYALVDEKAKIVGDIKTCVICRACENACPAGVIKVIEG